MANDSNSERQAGRNSKWPELPVGFGRLMLRFDDKAAAYLERELPSTDVSAWKPSLLRDADAGDAVAQFLLGASYYLGHADLEGGETDTAKWIRESAELGHAEAQYVLGAWYHFGEGVQGDYKKAMEWYRKAADQGSVEATYSIGNCSYEHELEGDVDIAEAILWYRDRAEQGDAVAQFNLGLCSFYNIGVAADYCEAVKWYRKAAEQGHKGAQYMLYLCCSNGLGGNEDSGEAIMWYNRYWYNREWYRKPTGLGDAASLISSILYGEGAPKKEAEAVTWYRKAAEQGHMDAQYQLGDCYYCGNGVDEDEVEAVKWYRMAAAQGHKQAIAQLGAFEDVKEEEEEEEEDEDEDEGFERQRTAKVAVLAMQGDMYAQYRIGELYHYGGPGVPRDYTNAAKWYRKAADQGDAAAKYKLGLLKKRADRVAKAKSDAANPENAEAQYKLGRCYLYGWGVGKNNSEAVKWFRKAAENGLAAAQYHSGMCYDSGNGVAMDKGEAAKWYYKAADQGHADARKRLAELAGRF